MSKECSRNYRKLLEIVKEMANMSTKALKKTAWLETDIRWQELV
jgi:hypothetical protein